MLWPLAEAKRPGIPTAVEPGYGKEAKDCAVPSEPRTDWATGPPPSTKFSTTRKPGIPYRAYIPLASATAVNDRAAGSAPASAAMATPAEIARDRPHTATLRRNLLPASSDMRMVGPLRFCCEPPLIRVLGGSTPSAGPSPYIHRYDPGLP